MANPLLGVGVLRVIGVSQRVERFLYHRWRRRPKAGGRSRQRCAGPTPAKLKDVLNFDAVSAAS